MERSTCLRYIRSRRGSTTKRTRASARARATTREQERKNSTRSAALGAYQIVSWHSNRIRHHALHYLPGPQGICLLVDHGHDDDVESLRLHHQRPQQASESVDLQDLLPDSFTRRRGLVSLRLKLETDH
eukprot:751957-Hanusia_phi.AAC.6